MILNQTIQHINNKIHILEKTAAHHLGDPRGPLIPPWGARKYFFLEKHLPAAHPHRSVQKKLQNTTHTMDILKEYAAHHLGNPCGPL